MEYSRSQKAERAIFTVREVVHDLPVYQTRGMASAVDVGGKQCLLTWKGVFNEDDRALTNHKPVKFHQSSGCKENNYQLGKSKIGQAGSFSFIPVEGLKSSNALMLMVPESNVIENEVCAQSFNEGNKLLKFKFQYIKKEKKHVLTSFEGKGTIEKFAVLGSPIINNKAVIGVVGEDADGQLIPCFITQTELGQHKQASHSTDSAAQPSVLQSSEEKHQEKDPSEGGTGNVPFAPAPAPPSHQPISGTSQEECKESREERHKLASEHKENDSSEGGTGNVPYAPGGPGETTKDLENVKHVIRESKCESKGVLTRDITHGLIEAVSDMGLIVSDNDGKGNCLFRALSEQLRSVKKIKIPHDELRKTLVQYLKENPETKDRADLYSMLDENQRTRFGGWDEYLTDMAKDGIWGDEMILFAAANRFKTVINVISSSPGKERQEIPVRPECKVEDENPIWLGHIYDCHFVSLLKVRMGNIPLEWFPYLALEIQGNADWKMLGLSLKLSFAELNGIEIDNDEEYERIYMMLKTWWKTGAASYDKLAFALRKHGLEMIFENFCRMEYTPPLKKVVNLPGNLKEGPIDSEALSDIAGAVMRRCKRLGRALGVKDARIDEIVMNYPKKVNKQSFLILKAWKLANYDGASYYSLAQALYDRTVQLGVVVNDFCLKKIQ